MIYLGADHAGFNLKEQIKEYLQELGYEYKDLGAKELNPKDDYPDFALLVAKKVAETNEKGILICGTGIGVCVTANKVDGVRAALCDSQRDARLSREHDNANVLCLDANETKMADAKKIVRAWLETEFTGEERHKRRLDKIKDIEKTN